MRFRVGFRSNADMAISVQVRFIPVLPGSRARPGRAAQSNKVGCEGFLMTRTAESDVTQRGDVGQLFYSLPTRRNVLVPISLLFHLGSCAGISLSYAQRGTALFWKGPIMVFMAVDVLKMYAGEAAFAKSDPGPRAFLSVLNISCS